MKSQSIWLSLLFYLCHQNYEEVRFFLFLCITVFNTTICTIFEQFYDDKSQKEVIIYI